MLRYFARTRRVEHCIVHGPGLSALVEPWMLVRGAEFSSLLCVACEALIRIVRWCFRARHTNYIEDGHELYSRI